MINRLILIAFFLFPHIAAAEPVDGYKEAKFGMSFAEISRKNMCTWTRIDNPARLGVESYICADFNFGGKITQAYIELIDDYLIKLTIQPNIQNTEAIINGLTEKYGEPSAANLGDFQEVALGNRTQAELYFKEGTVIFSAFNLGGAKSVNVSYRSPDYRYRLKAAGDRVLQHDL